MVARRAGLKRRHPTSTATITARSRNLGISWGNEPERIWNADRSSSWLSIRTPEPPKASSCPLWTVGAGRVGRMGEG